jgi:hypothetical protein
MCNFNCIDPLLLFLLLLGVVQKNEIAGLTKKTKTSLWETPPNGMHFTNTIYAILKRENNWVSLQFGSFPLMCPFSTQH